MTRYRWRTRRKSIWQLRSLETQRWVVNPTHLRDALENVLTTLIRESKPGSKVTVELSGLTINPAC